MILVLSAAPAFASAAETKTAALPALSKTAAAVKVQPTKAQAEEKKLKKVEKSLAGKIGFVRKTKMSVEFAADKEIGAEEMLFSVDQKVGLKNAKDFSKLAYGDEVRVKYTETYRLPEVPGKEEVLLGKVVTEIELIKSALAPKPVTDVMTKGEET